MTHASPALFGAPVLSPRFWTKVEESSDGCRVWIAGKTSTGYGNYTVDNTSQRAHRVSYEALIGEIPTGLVLDHLCRVRACVNPAHLEPVTHQVNILRGETLAASQVRRTHCPQGHPYDAANTVVWRGTNKRRCRTCHNEKTKLEKRAKKAAQQAA